MGQERSHNPTDDHVKRHFDVCYGRFDYPKRCVDLGEDGDELDRVNRDALAKPDQDDETNAKANGFLIFIKLK